jgi:transcriptional regulator with XRE-family HTH domain
MDASTLQTLFGCRVQKLRERKDHTQEELAEATRLSVEYVSKVERGLASSSFAVIARLAKVLEVAPVELFSLASPENARQ